MRKQIQKGRCVKRRLDKCPQVALSYDKIQEIFAIQLSEKENVESFTMNVPLSFSNGESDENYPTPKQAHTTDFYVRYTDGSAGVYECAYRCQLRRNAHLKNLELSRRYWEKKGITQWYIVTEKEEGILNEMSDDETT